MQELMTGKQQKKIIEFTFPRSGSTVESGLENQYE